MTDRGIPKLELPSDRPPIFVSAGVIKSEEQIELFSQSPHLAVQVIGSISEHEHVPDDIGQDFYYDEGRRLANNARRLRNPGRKIVERYLPGSIDALHEAGQLAVLAITAVAGEDPEQVLPRLAVWADAMGADGIELNGSCPNQAGALLCDDPDKTLRTCNAVREAVGDSAYLILKVPRQGEMRIRHNKRLGLPVDAIATLNALKSPPMTDPNTGEPVIRTESGFVGESGPRINSIARRELASWLRPVGSRVTEWPVTEPEYDVWSVGGLGIGAEAGREIYDRIHGIGAFAVGGAQAIYRAPDPLAVIAEWATGYRTMATNAAA